MTSQIESIRWIQYTSLYGKGIKKIEINSMETTMTVTKPVEDNFFRMAAIQ